MPRVHSILRKLYGNDRIPRDPEALKSCMWAPCADYLLQDDCDFKNLYFSQKSPQCDPSALLVRENRNSGQNFNWSSIMWKQQLLLWLYVLCLGGLNPRWGAITTHSLSLKAATPQTPKKAWINQAKRLSSFSTLITCAYFPFQPMCWRVKCTPIAIFPLFFGQNHIRGAAIKDERFVRKEVAFWRVSYSCTHGGPRSKGCNHRMKIFLHQNSLFILLPPPQMSLCCDPFRKLVTSQILSELRVPISTSLKSTFSTGCNFSTNAIRFCRTVKNLLNMCWLFGPWDSWENILFAFLLEPPTYPTIISMPVFRKQHCN